MFSVLFMYTLNDILYQLRQKVAKKEYRYERALILKINLKVGEDKFEVRLQSISQFNLPHHWQTV